jgi:hypothetical protein
LVISATEVSVVREVEDTKRSGEADIVLITKLLADEPT